jgi:hypothetical protein
MKPAAETLNSFTASRYDGTDFHETGRFGSREVVGKTCRQESTLNEPRFCLFVSSSERTALFLVCTSRAKRQQFGNGQKLLDFVLVPAQAGMIAAATGIAVLRVRARFRVS